MTYIVCRCKKQQLIKDILGNGEKHWGLQSWLEAISSQAHISCVNGNRGSIKICPDCIRQGVSNISYDAAMYKSLNNNLSPTVPFSSTEGKFFVLPETFHERQVISQFSMKPVLILSSNKSEVVTKHASCMNHTYPSMHCPHECH